MDWRAQARLPRKQDWRSARRLLGENEGRRVQQFQVLMELKLWPTKFTLEISMWTIKTLESTLSSGFNEANMGAMLREIFVLGSESVSVMLRWSFRILSVNKDVQRMIQDEIDRVAGDRCVEWEDRDK